MVEIRFRINEKAHEILQRFSAKEGVPMSYIMRGCLYNGLHNKLRAMKKEELR